MDVIKGFLSEQEVLDMPVQTLVAFSKTFSVNMKKYVSEYIDSPEANKDVVDKLSVTIGDDVAISTFHYIVHGKGIPKLLYETRLTNLAQLVQDNEIDLHEYIDTLNWLTENESKIKPEIAPRNKDNYAVALSAIKEFMTDKTVHHDHNIAELMVTYKDSLFCPKREKAHSTGMAKLVDNKKDRKLQLKAAEYHLCCQENNISPNIAREV